MKFPPAIFLALLALTPLSAWTLGPAPSQNGGLDPSVLSKPPIAKILQPFSKQFFGDSRGGDRQQQALFEVALNKSENV